MKNIIKWVARRLYNGEDKTTVAKYIKKNISNELQAYYTAVAGEILYETIIELEKLYGKKDKSIRSRK